MGLSGNQVLKRAGNMGPPLKVTVIRRTTNGRIRKQVANRPLAADISMVQRFLLGVQSGTNG